MLAAQLGKQLLDKTGELQAQLDELDKSYSDLKANHEHLNSQYAALTTVRRAGRASRRAPNRCLASRRVALRS